MGTAALPPHMHSLTAAPWVGWGMHLREESESRGYFRSPYFLLFVKETVIPIHGHPWTFNAVATVNPPPVFTPQILGLDCILEWPGLLPRDFWFDKSGVQHTHWVFFFLTPHMILLCSHLKITVRWYRWTRNTVQVTNENLKLLVV